MREYRRIAEQVVRPELGTVRLLKLTAAQLDRLYGGERPGGRINPLPVTAAIVGRRR